MAVQTRSETRHQSSLLRLPPEIRVMIYRHLFRGAELYHSDPTSVGQREGLATFPSLCRRFDQERSDSMVRTVRLQDKNLKALLCTSQVIRHGARPVLDANLTVTFSSIAEFVHCTELVRDYLPHARLWETAFRNGFWNPLLDELEPQTLVLRDRRFPARVFTAATVPLLESVRAYWQSAITGHPRVRYSRGRQIQFSRLPGPFHKITQSRDERGFSIIFALEDALSYKTGSQDLTIVSIRNKIVSGQ